MLKIVTNFSGITKTNDNINYTIENRVFYWLIITRNIGKYHNRNHNRKHNSNNIIGVIKEGVESCHNNLATILITLSTP